MKLSKKGKSRIHEMIDCAFEAHPDDAKGVQVLAKKYLTECDDFELEPDDFQCGYFQNGKDHIVLTVDEVFTLKQMIQWVMKSSSLGRTNTVFLEETYKILNKHFEQAEGK